MNQQETFRDFRKEALAVIPKNKRETLLMYMDEFNGKPLAHIRPFVSDADGALRPTGKGVALSPELCQAVAEGVQKVADRFNAQSLEAA